MPSLTASIMYWDLNRPMEDQTCTSSDSNSSSMDIISTSTLDDTASESANKEDDTAKYMRYPIRISCPVFGALVSWLPTYCGPSSSHLRQRFFQNTRSDINRSRKTTSRESKRPSKIIDTLSLPLGQVLQIPDNA
ncbi:hypothetical protein RND71_008293 [Anisodus tanguticus]|uniref:Uncharacterized protein n=1 Tax=Anisodus tanguticus TaxID=243964 RepID=A0AAE1VTP8_9SOLA|nr:hypothetical protein RND71_008293 [Anisodus tanguticus]